jgi:hypothetical protein
MQYGRALDRILWEILLSNPSLGPVYLFKLDISNSFYRITLNINDILRLGVAVPTAPGNDPLLAFPLVLPMGWKNSPPVFPTATETIANLINMRLCCLVRPLPHHLDNLAENIASPDPGPPDGVVIDHISQDLLLPAPSISLAYTNVYVDDFIAAAQRSPSGHSGLDNRHRVRRLLLHAVNNAFPPLSDKDSPEWRKPVSLKKLKAGN